MSQKPDLEEKISRQLEWDLTKEVVGLQATEKDRKNLGELHMRGYPCTMVESKLEHRVVVGDRVLRK